MNATKIVGANPANGRRSMDFYPTPPDVTESLLNALDIPKGATIWECAAGDGDMADVFDRLGYKTIRTDLRTGTDFLTDIENRQFDWIITNPPFKLAEQFIRKSATYNKPFAMLLKSQYWHAKTRVRLFNEITPSAVYPLAWRPNFLFKEQTKSSPLMDVMWCVWMPESKGTTYKPLERIGTKNE